MRYRALLIAYLIWPGFALSDTWSGMASKIPGVELLSINKDESGSYVGLLDGQSKEFLSHCTSGGKVHVSGFTAAIKCQLGDPGIQGEFFQIKLLTKESLRGSGPFIMAKKEIAPRTKLLEFSQEESERLKTADRQSLLAIDKEASNCFRNKYKELGEKGAKRDHESYVRSIKSSGQYKKYFGKKFKISSPNGLLFISSIGLDSCEFIGWDIVNVVYALVNDTLIEATRFHGCIEGGFRDLNGDGVPEVLTHTCENGESTHSSYWTIHPKAKVLLQH